MLGKYINYTSPYLSGLWDFFGTCVVQLTSQMFFSIIYEFNTSTSKTGTSQQAKRNIRGYREVWRKKSSAQRFWQELRFQVDQWLGKWVWPKSLRWKPTWVTANWVIHLKRHHVWTSNIWGVPQVGDNTHDRTRTSCHFWGMFRLFRVYGFCVHVMFPFFNVSRHLKKIWGEVLHSKNGKKHWDC